MNRHLLTGILASIGCLVFATVRILAPADIDRVQASVTPPTIKIGAVASLTGTSAEGNQEMIEGMNLYLDQIHSTVAGAKVSLIVEDDESNPTKAKAKFKKLVEQDKVAAVGGIYFSPSANTIVGITDQTRVPVVLAVAGGDDFTQRKPSHWVIRTCPSSSQRSFPLGEYTAKKMGLKRVVILSTAFSYGYEIAGGFQDALEENGGKVVQKLWVGLDTQDFSSVIKEMRKDADAVFAYVTIKTAPQFLRQYHDLGPGLPLVGAMTTLDEDCLVKAGQYALGSISTSPYCASVTDKGTRQFNAAYTTRYGKTPSWFAAAGYINMEWICKGLQAVNSSVDDKEKLLAALRAVELPETPCGPLKLDSHGGPICNILVKRVVKTPTTYSNEVIQTYPAVSQFWKWGAESRLSRPAYSRDYPPLKAD